MPVIVAPRDYAAWLDPGLRDPDAVKPFLRAWPADGMEAFPVSTRVNRPTSNDARCIEAV
jgi:putative SOS response-associated peptidase YedK